MKTNKINIIQQIIIKSFSCERISKNKNNLQLVKNFSNAKNPNLVEYLIHEAYNDDKNNKNAVYLIKDIKGRVCFYFGLKCGLLYKPEKKEDIVKELKIIEEQIKKINNVKRIKVTKDYKEIKDMLKDLKKAISKYSETSEDYINVRGMLNAALSKANKINDKYNLFVMDEEKEAGRKIKRINESYPGIELTMFCKNDNYNDLLKKCFGNISVGKVFFWEHVYKQVLKTVETVGGEYLYLFAADNSPDQELVNYYDVDLKFKKENLGVLKPMYDWACIFMSQKISDMKKQKKLFYENYNKIDEV